MKVCEGTLRTAHEQIVFDEEREEECPACALAEELTQREGELSDARDAIATLQRTNEELERDISRLEQEKQAARYPVREDNALDLVEQVVKPTLGIR